MKGSTGSGLSRGISNYLNPIIGGLPSSATLKVNEECRRIQSEGGTVYKLGFGESPFPVPVCMQEELVKNKHMNEYLPVQGAPVVREAVAEYYSNLASLDLKGDQVLIAPGSKILMYILMRVLNIKHLLLPNPSWVTYQPQGIIADREVTWINTNYDGEYRMHMDDLERVAQSLGDGERYKLLIINSPSNPTGMNYTKEEYIRMAEICKRNKIYVLSDEIYNEMNYKPGWSFDTLATYYPEGTFITNGISKIAGAGGWRMGFMICPAQIPDVMVNMKKMASQLYSCVSTPIQFASLPLYKGAPEARDYIRKVCKTLKIVSDHVVPAFKQAGIKIHYPDGSFNLLPDCSHMPKAEGLRIKYMEIAPDMGLNEWVIAKQFDETKVACVPSTFFGRDSNELTCKMALVDYNGTQALENVDAMSTDQFLREVCPNVVNGVDQMINWWKDPNVI